MQNRSSKLGLVYQSGPKWTQGSKNADVACPAGLGGTVDAISVLLLSGKYAESSPPSFCPSPLIHSFLSRDDGDQRGDDGGADCGAAFTGAAVVVVGDSTRPVPLPNGSTTPKGRGAPARIQ